MDNHSSKFATKCVHAGMTENEHHAVIPPIYQTSTFSFESAKHGASLFSGEESGYIYSRMANPTVEAMENAVAKLEGGFKALGCASGMAAIHTVFASLLKAGDHVICSSAVYGPTVTLLQTIMKKFDVDSTFVDTTDSQAVKDAIQQNTVLVFIETPGNPTLAISDLQEIVNIAHPKNILVAVDNTFMSPALQRPFEFGADVIIHSMTKFLNGHSDVVGGIVIVKDEPMYLKMRKTLNQTGGVIDPFNSFLVHRGIKTLQIRIEKHCSNAQKIAEYLEENPAVKWVRYPGLKSHPQYEIGLKQHDAPGGMITFELKGGFEAGELLINNVKLCKLAVSLGGVESLIQHPASMTHFTMGKDARALAGIGEGLIRLSVGIEDVDDIISDLETALSFVAELQEVNLEQASI